jgi:hypothetical protein
MVDEYSFMFAIVCVIVELYYLIAAILDACGANRIKRVRNRPKRKDIKHIYPAIDFAFTFLPQARRSTSHLWRNYIIFLEFLNMICDSRANLAD